MEATFINKRIRILHLEDSLKDSELIRSLIESGGIGHDYFLAGNEKDYLKILETEKIDIILCDFSLPDYNGNEALKVTREKYSYIPFIFVSGTMGEDNAINAMLNGATDYVLKNKLERLVPAIKRALHEHELEINRKLAEEMLIKSKEMLLEAQKLAHLGVWEWMADNDVVTWSDELYQIAGIDPKLPAPTYAEHSTIYTPQSWFLLKTAVENAIKTGESYQLELELIRPDGDIRNVIAFGGAKVGNEDHINGLYGTVQDITERKLAEKAIRESEKKYRDLFNEDLSGNFISTVDGKILLCNPAFAKILGFDSVEEIMKENSKTIYRRPEDRIEFINLIKKKKKVEYFEIPLVRRDGEEIIVQENIIGEFDGNGELVLLKGYIFDITNRKRVEQELIDAKEKAEEMSRLKSNFLSNMSHEIRTPLNGILGFSDIIQEEDDLEEVKKMAGIINDSGNRLLNSLNQILDLSSLESNTKKVNYKLIDINYIIKETIVLFSVTADKKNLKLTIESDINTLMAFTEPDLISKTLNNLISNAIIYTNHGSVILRAKEEIINEKECIVINVIDTGIGIEKNNLEIIFEEFRQVSEGWGRSFEGTGLGLSLCKKYMNLIGGSISVTSKIGEGSDFRLVIPKNILKDDKDIKTKVKSPVETSQRDSLQIKSGFKPKILYIENDPECIKLVKYILANQYDIDSAASGAEGIEKTKNNEYGLILLDINLSKGITGIEVLSEIRKIPYYKDIPVIALTAFAMAVDEEEFRAGGCTDYLSKPFKKEMLLEKISKALFI